MKDGLIAPFIAQGGLQILVKFLSLDFTTSDRIFVLQAIDRIADLYSNKKRQLVLIQDDITRILVGFGIFDIFSDLVPQLIFNADNHYKHGSSTSILSDSHAHDDASMVVSEQNRSEKYLEKTFDLILKLLQTEDTKSDAVQSGLLAIDKL